MKNFYKPSKLVLASVIALNLFSAGCSSLSDRFDNLPFMKSQKENKIKEANDRISILPSSNTIEIDKTIADSLFTAPTAVNVTAWSNSSGPQAFVPNILGDGSLSIAFSKKISSGAKASGGLSASPIIADGKVFTIDNSMEINAVDANNGNKIWSKSLGNPKERGLFNGRSHAIAGGISYENDKVFVTTGYGEIVALSAKTGEILWRHATQSPNHSAPLTIGGRTYFVSTDSQLFAVNNEDGATVWTQSSTSESARVRSSSSSILANETIVTPFASGDLVASLAINGKKLWQESLTRADTGTSLSLINDIAGHPVHHEGIVYAASQSGIVAAIDLRSGVKIWDKPIGSIQSPWLAGEFVFIISTDAELISLNRTNGAVKWIKTLDKYKNVKKRKNRITWTGPVMIDGKLIIGSSTGQILSIDPNTGETNGQFATKEELLIAPVVANGTVYFYSNKGELIALR